MYRDNNKYNNHVRACMLQQIILYGLKMEQLTKRCIQRRHTQQTIRTVPIDLFAIHPTFSFNEKETLCLFFHFMNLSDFFVCFWRLCVSLNTSVYLCLFLTTTYYLGLSLSPSDYLKLPQTTSDYLSLFLTTFDYLGITLSPSQYL